MRSLLTLKYTHTLARCSPCFLVRKNVGGFSNGRMGKLNALEQEALVAYYAFQFISEFRREDYLKDTASIRERLVDKAIFTSYILEKVKGKFPKEAPTWLEQIGIEEGSLNNVLSAFRLNDGFDSTSPLYSSLAFAGSSSKTKTEDGIPESTKTVINPSIQSSSLLKQFLDNGNLIVSGERGTGKRFSYLLYSYLSSFIIRCKTQNKQQTISH